MEYGYLAACVHLFFFFVCNGCSQDIFENSWADILYNSDIFILPFTACERAFLGTGLDKTQNLMTQKSIHEEKSSFFLFSFYFS